jgi:hypothetical protein
VATCLQGMTPLSFLRRGGRVRRGMGCVGWVVKLGGERVGKTIYNLFIPCLCMRREEGEHCCSKRHYFGVLLLFFFWRRRRRRKWNVIGKNPKIGYDTGHAMQLSLGKVC